MFHSFYFFKRINKKEKKTEKKTTPFSLLLTLLNFCIPLYEEINFLKCIICIHCHSVVYSNIHRIFVSSLIYFGNIFPWKFRSKFLTSGLFFNGNLGAPGSAQSRRIDRGRRRAARLVLYGRRKTMRIVMDIEILDLLYGSWAYVL